MKPQYTSPSAGRACRRSLCPESKIDLPSRRHSTRISVLCRSFLFAVNHSNRITYWNPTRLRVGFLDETVRSCLIYEDLLILIVPASVFAEGGSSPGRRRVCDSNSWIRSAAIAVMRKSTYTVRLPRSHLSRIQVTEPASISVRGKAVRSRSRPRLPRSAASAGAIPFGKGP